MPKKKKDFFMLMNNSMENGRNHRDIKLLNIKILNHRKKHKYL